MSSENPNDHRRSIPRASIVNIDNFCTIMLVDINNRPIMNLHKVPQRVFVSDVKKKISDRLMEVGRNLPADLMILNFGENGEVEMVDEHPLNLYNTMGLSRIQVQIVKRHKFDINVVAVKPEAKCMCIKTANREELSFEVRVPSTCYVKQLRMEVARRMNCSIDRHDLELFADPQLQELLGREGTCRSRGILHNGTIYVKCPPDFNLNNLAPLEVPRAPADGQKPEEQRAAGPQLAEDLLADSTEAEEDKGEQKTALQIDFEKKAGGYSPSGKDLTTLPATLDYKGFQSFLTIALHTEDLAESFQEFFSLFDTQATGDLSAKQLCNIVQMYGDEPLSKAEAEKFTKERAVDAKERIIMGSDSIAPIKVIVDRQVKHQIAQNRLG